MGLFQKLFGGAAGEPTQGSQRFVSGRGVNHGAPTVPFLVYGHHAKETAQQIAGDTTMPCLAVWGLDELDRVLATEEAAGLLAMSRVESPGEAGDAIRLYRSKSRQPGLAIYGAWDYNIPRAAQRAVEYGADGIAMPGILISEYYAYLFGALAEVQAGTPSPTTVEQHRDRLARFTTSKSPFWCLQDRLISRYY